MTGLLNPFRFGASDAGTGQYSAVRALFLGGGDNYGLSCASMEIRETVGGPNVAVGGTAFSSSHYEDSPGSLSFIAAKAFDGDPLTFWNSAGQPTSGYPPEHLGYTFAAGVRRNVAQVVIQARADSSQPQQAPQFVLVQATIDGATWLDLFIGHASLPWTQGQTQVFTLPTIADGATARYIEVVVLLSADPYKSFAEIDFKKAGVSLRSGGTASASSTVNSSFLPPNAVDGNLNTAWHTGEANRPCWWRLDFGVGNGIVRPDTVILTARRDYPDAYKQAPTQFFFGRSNDGTNFVPFGRQSVSTAWTDGEDRTFTVG
jgi:hypothetical protein